MTLCQLGWLAAGPSTLAHCEPSYACMQWGMWLCIAILGSRDGCVWRLGGGAMRQAGTVTAGRSLRGLGFGG